MIQNHSLVLKNRQIKLTEFGQITTLNEFDDTFEISNDDGNILTMRKVYHKWPHALQKCRKSLSIGVKIVTRCSANSDHSRFFNEVYIDPNGAPLLAFPSDGKDAPETVEQLVMERIWKQEVWGEDDNTLVSSSYAPLGQVTPVEGGFKFSGHWQWSSGSEHCEWALLGGLIFPPEGGAPEYRTFLIPKSDYEIKDTWYSMGLKATGSQDIHVNDVFVPEYRTHKQSDGFNLTNPGYEVNKNDLYKIPWGQLFVRAVSTPAIGATKKMLELFIDGANNKASSDPSKLAGDTHTQTIVAEAAAKLDAIETVMFRNYDVMVDKAGNQGGIPMIDRVKFRYDASLVIEKCLEVVDTLFSNAGGGAVFAGSEIQKIFLDVHTSRAHVANNPVSFSRNYGAMQLGVENTDYFV